MALPKNKSRKIVVEGIVYRYVISISWKDEGEFDFNITIQSEKHNGCKLILKGLVTSDLWLNFPDIVSEEIDKNSYPTITPKHIVHFIKNAIDIGWDFSKSGKDFIQSVT
ncbi:MAG: hypothetical protein GY714_01175 [Desulfobacterales bacterium]|nr:hypothetical protein [Desulfobacterales bacterium]MCP4158430.1 hypothetical protein [Deltaproteobacteria bacterium]